MSEKDDIARALTRMDDAMDAHAAMVEKLAWTSTARTLARLDQAIKATGAPPRILEITERAAKMFDEVDRQLEEHGLINVPEVLALDVHHISKLLRFTGIALAKGKRIGRTPPNRQTVSPEKIRSKYEAMCKAGIANPASQTARALNVGRSTVYRAIKTRP